MAEDSLPIDWEFPLEHFSIDWESIPEFCQGLQQQDSSPLSTNNGMSSGHSTTVHFLQPQHPLVHVYQSLPKGNSFLAPNQHAAENIITLPLPVPSAIHSHNSPLTPSAYADSGPPILAPSPMEMSSPPLMHSPAAGQSPATSNPPFTPSSKLFYCKYIGCSQGSNRRRDLNRHVESVHEGKKYPCRIPDCTKAYTREYTLRKHEKEKHSRRDH